MCVHRAVNFIIRDANRYFYRQFNKSTIYNRRPLEFKRQKTQSEHQQQWSDFLVLCASGFDSQTQF